MSLCARCSRVGRRLLALGVLVGASTSTAAPVELKLSEGNCPSREQLVRALSAIGIEVSSEEAAHQVSVAVVSVEGGGFEIKLTDGDRATARTLKPQGECDAQAAALAAVIERFARPVLTTTPPEKAAGDSPAETAPGPSPAKGAQPPPARSQERPPARGTRRLGSENRPLAAQGSGTFPIDGTTVPRAPVAEHGVEGEVEGVPLASASVSVPRRTWVGLGVGLFSSSKRFLRPGLELRLAHELSSHIGISAVVGWPAGWRSPVGEGEVKADELRVAVAAALQPLPRVPVLGEVSVGTQGVWARSEAIARSVTARFVNPTVGAGIILRMALEHLVLEAAVRGTFFPRTQLFQVDGAEVLVMPQFELSPTVVLAYCF